MRMFPEIIISFFSEATSIDTDTMRILSHNMLQCNVKGCGAGNFPLKLNGESTRKESEFNEQFIRHMMSKIDYPALVQASQDVSLRTFYALCIFVMLEILIKTLYSNFCHKISLCSRVYTLYI